MREFAKLGHMSIILTSDSNTLANVPTVTNDYYFQHLEGVGLYWIRTLKYKTAKSFRRILSWLHFEWRLLRMPKHDLPKPDVVVVSSLSLLTIFNGLLIRYRTKCRLVFEVRDIWPLTLTEEGGFSRWNPLVVALSWVEKLGYRSCDAIVGTMPNLQEHVKKVSGSNKPTVCIPMGIDDAMLTGQTSVPEGYLSTYLPNDKFIVAHAGTIGITNALDIYFECAASLVEHTNIHFVIIGDGDLKEHYQDLYGELPNLTFAPKVEKRMVQSVLKNCSLVFFSVYDSAVWKYGQSLNKVIDYMLAGKPIVASYSGFPSMINEAACGTYVPAGDVDALRSEILRFSALSPEEREQTGARGRDWLLANRNYRKLAAEYLEVMFP